MKRETGVPPQKVIDLGVQLEGYLYLHMHLNSTQSDTCTDTFLAIDL